MYQNNALAKRVFYPRSEFFVTSCFRFSQKSSAQIEKSRWRTPFALGSGAVEPGSLPGHRGRFKPRPLKPPVHPSEQFSPRSVLRFLRVRHSCSFDLFAKVGKSWPNFRRFLYYKDYDGWYSESLRAYSAICRFVLLVRR